MPRYAELIYNGFWFAPEREMLQALIDKARSRSRGGAAQALQGLGSRRRPTLTEEPLHLGHVTFGADAVYDQRGREGFIRLNALAPAPRRRRGRPTPGGKPHLVEAITWPPAAIAQ